jgi:raffinose/stachyose/melibiose transport system substrate-binding protein
MDPAPHGDGILEKEEEKMKKYLLFAIVLLAFTAIGAGAQTTLNFLWYQDATSAGYSTDVAIWQKFKTDNPDINVNQEILFSNAYHDKLTAYIAAGQMPDVFYLWPSLKDSSALVQGKKLAKDLKVLLGADFLKDFAATALDPNQQSSKMLLELPQSFTFTSVLYTNKKLLSDLGIPLPKTYADLKAMVVKLKVKNIQTVLLPDGDGWPGESCLFSTIVDRLLGDAFQDQLMTGKAKFTDPAFVNALKFWQTMFTDGVISWTNIQQPYGDGPGLFAGGKAAFFVDGDWRTGAFLTDKGTGVALIPPANQTSDFGFMAFPQIPGEKFAQTVPGIAGTGLAIASSVQSGSDVEKAAVRLLKYYYGPDVQLLNYETGAYIPARKGITSDKVEPFVGMMAAFKNNVVKSSYVFDGVFAPEVVNVLNPGLQAIGLGAQTPAQVAAAMQKAQDALLKK